jgi:xyloglucan-specific exo-beta-1,4-glucanase
MHSGLWKSTNYQSANPTWINVTDYLMQPGLGVTDIVIDPVINPATGHHTMWISTGESSQNGSGYGIGVLRSTDGGQTWSLTALNPAVYQEIMVTKIAIDLASPAGNRTLFATVNDKIFKSFNDGVGWSFLALSGLPQPNANQNC